MQASLYPSESRIDTWPMLYTPPGGGRYTGKLTITNERLLYDTKYQEAPQGQMPGQQAATWDDGCLVIIKTDIVNVAVVRTILAKEAILTLTDGSMHTFNYGSFNIDKVVEAIKSR